MSADKKLKEKIAKVTRLVIVDHKEEGLGRLIDEWDTKIDFSFQDDGKTLKIFMKDYETNKN